MGTFDAVIDPVLLATEPRPGNVVSGWFWLSGRLHVRYQQPNAASGWLKRLVGR